VARAAADKRMDTRVGILLHAAPDLVCVCMQNAFNLDRDRKQEFRKFLDLVDYAELSPCGFNIFGWIQKPVRAHLLALRQVELITSVGFAPYTGWEVRREDADRLEPWNLGGVDEHDAPAFGPQSPPGYREGDSLLDASEESVRGAMDLNDGERSHE
jgi:hypothetical protein